MTQDWVWLRIGIVGLGILCGTWACAGKTSTSTVGDSVSEQTDPQQPVVEERVAEEPVVQSSMPPDPGFTEETILSSEAPDNVNHAPTVVPVYFLDIPFNFDKASLREDALTYVEVNAIRLEDEGVEKILLEGRADEIGTLDYNFVLGERRARAVREHLIRLGFDPSKFVVTSYGKVKPLCKEHNAECWQTNRSVHFESE